jgi:hypothetical protein
MTKYLIPFLTGVVLVLCVCLIYCIRNTQPVNTNVPVRVPVTVSANPSVNVPGQITDLFKQGLQINKETNPDLYDADIFGSVLVSMAWQQFAEEPDAAPLIFAVLDSYAAKFTPRAQYLLWDTFLENLETALLKSRDVNHLRTNWSIRQRAIEEQTEAITVWVENTTKKLDEYKQTVEKIPLNDISLPDTEIQESLEFLLGGEESVTVDKSVLNEKTKSIAELIDSKLADIVKKFEADVETEKKRDLTDSVSPIPDEANSKERSKVWKKGRYQELLDDAMPIIQLQNNPAITFWAAYIPADKEDSSFIEKVGKAYQDISRLQRLRYNLWSVRLLSVDSTAFQFSLIDTGLLEPSVNALYSQRESELISSRPNERERAIREILTREKISLSAF